MPADRPSGTDPASVEHIEAKRATTGSDLWPAIEAAQYARVILCVQPRSETEREAMVEFVEGFTRYVETWEGLQPISQSAALETLGRQIVELGRRDLHVHWGVTERTIDDSMESDDRIPLAVVVIDGTEAPTAMVTVPLDLEIDTSDDDEDPEDD